jgi:hypothetical protein
VAWAAFLPEIAAGATEATAGAAEGAAVGAGAGAVESSAPATSESTASRMTNFTQGSFDHQSNKKQKEPFSPTSFDFTNGGNN